MLYVYDVVHDENNVDIITPYSYWCIFSFFKLMFSHF